MLVLKSEKEATVPAMLTCLSIVDAMLSSQKPSRSVQELRLRIYLIGLKKLSMRKTITLTHGIEAQSLVKYVVYCVYKQDNSKWFVIFLGGDFEEEYREAFQNATLIPQSSMRIARRRGVSAYPVANKLAGRWREIRTNRHFRFIVRTRET